MTCIMVEFPLLPSIPCRPSFHPEVSPTQSGSPLCDFPIPLPSSPPIILRPRESGVGKGGDGEEMVIMSTLSPSFQWPINISR